MKFFILFALSCVLLANVISATSEHHQKYKLTRITREADDDDEVDDPEIEASMKRRPKITRPSFSSGPKTTKKPDESAEAEKVPMVVAPLPQTDLQVPAALPVENSVQQSLQQQQQQQWKPQQRQEPQQQVGSRYQEGGNQVNSYSQSQSPVYQPVPPPAPVNPVMPIARGSRPRSSKSKYVDVDEYQQREELNPVSSRPQPLARAAVSEGAFAMDCPYGMRLSMCRLRAAQRLRS